MIQGIFYFGIAFVSCITLTFFVCRLGRKFHIYDMPDARRANKRTVPRLGGVPVTGSFFIAAGVMTYFLSSAASAPALRLLVPLLSGVAVIWLTGLWDDIYYVRARYKLLLQIAAAVTAYLLGLQIHSVEFPFAVTLELGDYALPVTVLWIIGVMNAVNLIDGVDGLCSGTTLCAFAGIGVMALMSGSDISVFICCALIGALAGFLVFNSSPASIFLGDSGAYFLGFVLAVLPIFVITESPAVSGGGFKATYVLFAAVPLMDIVLAVYRRWIRRVPIMTSDRGHMHHRFLDKGYGHSKTTLIMSAFSMVFALLGIVSSGGGRILSVTSVAASVAVAYILFRLCGITSSLKSGVHDGAGTSTALLLRKYIPLLISGMIPASNRAQIKNELDSFSKNTHMSSAWIVLYKNNGETDVLWKWGAESFTRGRRVMQLCKTFDICHTDNHFGFRFCWHSEYDDLPKNVDMLLDVAVNVIAIFCSQILCDNGKGSAEVHGSGFLLHDEVVSRVAAPAR